jgi:hypothetical protein
MMHWFHLHLDVGSMMDSAAMALPFDGLPAAHYGALMFVVTGC